MGRPKHIFIVEDNEIYSMMLDYTLAKDSIYKFISFKSGEECLKNLYLRPDIIILDYGLPGMNGYHTLLEIKKFNARTHVMILTGHEDEKLKGDLLAAGADDYILKHELLSKQIIDKVDHTLGKMESSDTGSGVKNKLLYFVLIAILLVISVFCYL
jgi:DNA-binding NarL/FixJ family response regulator